MQVSRFNVGVEVTMADGTVFLFVHGIPVGVFNPITGTFVADVPQNRAMTLLLDVWSHGEGVRVPWTVIVMLAEEV